MDDTNTNPQTDAPVTDAPVVEETTAPVAPVTEESAPASDAPAA